VSSRELADGTGTTAAQVRKDLSLFGSFGQRGRGYPVSNLAVGLEHILGLQRPWRVGLVGVGKIGSALLGHANLPERGFEIVAAFDADQRKTGRTLFGVEVLPMEDLERVVVERSIDLGIIATTADTAQSVATRLENAGIAGILSFAPTVVGATGGVPIRSMDVTLELEGLSFLVASAQAGRATGEGYDAWRGEEIA